MKKYQIGIVVIILLAIVSLGMAQGDKDKDMKAQTMTGKAGMTGVIVAPNDVKWGVAMPALPAGADVAILEGDPSKAGKPFTIRMKAPDGYKIPPHWHPTDQNMTVLEGTLMIGVGAKFDQTAAQEMTVGSYAKMPKGTRHYAWVNGDTVIQVNGVGPFEFTYVNPDDDPRKLTKK